MSRRTTECYSVYGLTLAVAACPVIAEALHERLRLFPLGAQTPADLCFDFHLVPAPNEHVVNKPAGPSRLLYEMADGEVEYFDLAQTIFISYRDAVRIQCEPAAGRATFSVVQPDNHNLWLLTHSLFTLPLSEVLKSKQLYSVHAAGVARNGLALLLAGPRGSGKSTLAIALVRAGFDLLTDDLIFLDATRKMVFGFSPEIAVTDQTVGFFPELSTAAPEEPGAGPKRAIAADRLYQRAVIPSARPAVLVFPRITSADTSRLVPIGADEALLQLVPNVFLTEADACQNHLNALGMLARECPSYRLEAARNLAEIPPLLQQLLETAAMASERNHSGA